MLKEDMQLVKDKDMHGLAGRNTKMKSRFFEDY
jgi:hypothetical protein